MAAYRRVYDSRHLQADCQEPESTPEPYARQSSVGYLFGNKNDNTGPYMRITESLSSRTLAQFSSAAVKPDEGDVAAMYKPMRECVLCLSTKACDCDACVDRDIQCHITNDGIADSDCSVNVDGTSGSGCSWLDERYWHECSLQCHEAYWSSDQCICHCSCCNYDESKNCCSCTLTGKISVPVAFAIYWLCIY